MTDYNFQAIVLAAGKGTRMKSDEAKVMHELLGRPMIDHVVRAALDAGAERVVVIVGHQRESVEAHLAERFGDRIAFAVQEEQLGTGHAVHAAHDYLVDGPDHTLVLSGDVPNIGADTLAEFVTAKGPEFHLAIMTALLDDASTYGRVVREEEGDVARIVEYADASPMEREITEINAGFYFGESAWFAGELEALCAVEPDNAQGEYYLTDLVARAAEDHHRVTGWVVDDPRHVRGVNTRAHLAEAGDFLRKRINGRWMEEGVTMIDPRTTIVEPEVELAPDVVLHPGVDVRGASRIGRGTVIENGVVVEECEIGEDVHVRPYCHLEHARVEAGAVLGPFAHLRPGADIGPSCKVGNFVEVKKVRMDEGSKANHHAYLGDGHVGAGSNIGAGTIFCNYDGAEKHFTRLGKRVFIGSNTALVAPVELGDDAYVGAGSTITEDVPGGALAVGRKRQRNIEGWAERNQDS